MSIIKSSTILISIGLIAFYATTVFIWCVLGAIIDPTLYLVYTSSAATLSTMVITKIQAVI